MAKRKITLVIYGLSVLDGENEHVDLNQVSDNSGLLECLKEYIDGNIRSYSKDPFQDTLFQFEQSEVEIVKNSVGQEDYRILFGRVKTGDYGIESELVNVRTGEVTNRSVEQADMMPFGFCIAVPAGKIENAVIILQTMSVYGMKLSLQKRLQECLTQIDSKLQLVMRAIAPKEYIDRYFENGILKKIRMIRYEIPTDESDKLGIAYGVRRTREERIIHSPLGFMERKRREIQECLAGQRSYTEIIELEDFEYDELKLEFSLGETNKTFDLKDMNSLVVNEDITNKVKQEGGHPVYSDLKKIMQSTAVEYLRGMGLAAR